MAEYKAIHGFTVQNRTADTDPVNIGQVYYRSDTGDMKVTLNVLGTGSWASGGNLPAVRNARPAGAGTQNAALVFGGGPGNGEKGFSYDGSSWTEIGDLNTARYNSIGVGNQPSALNVGGVLTASPSPPTNVTEEWDGSSWSETGNLNTARESLSASQNATAEACIVFGGNTATAVTAVAETFNGTSWTEVGDMNTARKKSGGFGTATSAIVAGGNTDTAVNNVESWNGNSWTEIAESGAKDNLGASGASGTSGLIFGGYAGGFIALAQEWNGTSWTEVADLATGRDQLGGTGQSALTALAFGGRNNGGALVNVEEWTVSQTGTNSTITD
tara:strand:+ start:283 stop:1272 length:990 start_codon:yes stop_codon:yes gene_type:complete